MEDQIHDLDVDAPPEFMCPITMSIMRDPVIMPDGQTYERSAIESALKVNPISPLTREPMDMNQARTNYALKTLIDKYIQDHLQELEKTPDTSTTTSTSQPDSEIPVVKVEDIKLDSFTAQYTSDSMLINIAPKPFEGRLPVSIIAIIDVSASMDLDASIKIEGVDNNKLTRLQLVQFSLKTITSLLGPSDCITLITFDTTARVELSNVHLTPEGKKNVEKMIDKMKTRNSTNLWDGIEKGIDEALKNKDFQGNTSLLVFTDGEPNINPPMGIVPTMKEKLSKFSIFFSISTFGFGFKIDAGLLEEICEIGNGIYGYCPDASMVGTIFINYVSSLISTISPLAKLKVSFDDKKVSLFDVVLYNGASTNVMVPLDDSKPIEKCQINLYLPLTNQTFLVNKIAPLDTSDEESVSKFRDQKYRKMLIDTIISNKVNNIDLDTSRENILKLFESVKNEKNRSVFLNNLMIDLYNDDKQHGIIARSYRKKKYNKKGKNIIFSLLRFHMLEQCGNFRDMSIQLYGNEIFRTFRKSGNQIFMNIPIPQAKKSQRSYRSRRSSDYGSYSDDANDYDYYDNDDDDDKKPKRLMMKVYHCKKKLYMSSDSVSDGDDDVDGFNSDSD